MEAQNVSRPLEGVDILLSASVPDELVRSPRAQDLYSALVIMVRHIIDAGGTIVFGGHPSITPLIDRAVRRRGGDTEQIKLFQLSRFRTSIPDWLQQAPFFSEVHWCGTGREDIDHELGEMRDAMSATAKAAIFIGGKTTGNVGKVKGIRDEYQRFTALHPDGPVYLLGMMDGETAAIIEDLNQHGEREPNGLTSREASLVHRSDNLYVIVPLILRDLMAISTANKPDKRSSRRGFRAISFKTEERQALSPEDPIDPIGIEYKTLEADQS